MRGILSNSHDPAFNLATEEYLLKDYPSDCFMLYRNTLSIIVGKHQNAMAEINFRYALEHQITVVRRLSGGGTVFHDTGNLNFCFIQSGKAGRLVDFRKFLMPVLELLHEMGLPVEYGGRNDLILEGKKISGNAEHIYHNRTLHHGTLLFSSDLVMLEQAIQVSPEKYRDKAVQSVRSKVTNIAPYLAEPLTIEAFGNYIFSGLARKFGIIAATSLDNNEREKIEQLAAAKYRSWEWNFGYSPAFDYQLNLKRGERSFQMRIGVNNGIIVQVETKAENNLENLIQPILLGKNFREDFILKTLADQFPDCQVIE